MKIPVCEVCNKPTNTRGSIIADYYYKCICTPCYDQLMEMESPSSGQARWNRERDFEDHEADIRQPYTDGKADKEFIRLYGETARKMFSDDEIREAERA